MENIYIGRYEDEETRQHWSGFIEPADGSWILFTQPDGPPVLFTERDPETGAVTS